MNYTRAIVYPEGRKCFWIMVGSLHSCAEHIHENETPSSLLSRVSGRPTSRYFRHAKRWQVFHNRCGTVIKGAITRTITWIWCVEQNSCAWAYWTQFRSENDIVMELVYLWVHGNLWSMLNFMISQDTVWCKNGMCHAVKVKLVCSVAIYVYF